MKEGVYISYAWATKTKGVKSHEEIVLDIEKSLKKDFKVMIDKKDLKYKGDIKKFEEQLGKGGKIILVISDKFLKSKHCMYEVLKINERGNVYQRIFPVSCYIPNKKEYPVRDEFDSEIKFQQKVTEFTHTAEQVSYQCHLTSSKLQFHFPQKLFPFFL